VSAKSAILQAAEPGAVIAHRLKPGEFNKAMELLQSGEAIKVVMRPE
jgi:threonine dehydrogenase-like Zn-dependent dehydrogenase